jgi:hypothetical protein
VLKAANVNIFNTRNSSLGWSKLMHSKNVSFAFELHPHLPNGPKIFKIHRLQPIHRQEVKKKQCDIIYTAHSIPWDSHLSKICNLISWLQANYIFNILNLWPVSAPRQYFTWMQMDIFKRSWTLKDISELYLLHILTLMITRKKKGSNSLYGQSQT